MQDPRQWTRGATEERGRGYGQLAVIRAVPSLCVPHEPGPQGFLARERYLKPVPGAGIASSTSFASVRPG